MRVTLFNLIRLTILVGIAATTVAVGVSGLQPVASHFRMVVPPHYGVINGFVLTEIPSAPSLLDSRTGEISRCPLPKGDVFDYGSCSPWQDDSGEFQVVGRWMRLEGEGSAEHCIGIGLARYALPSGRVLNRCELDVVPTSHPCWAPGTSAKVVFAGADGVLYHLEFPDKPDGSVSEDESLQPTPIRWACPMPGPRFDVRDPVWPAERRFKGLLIVSLSIGNVHPQVPAKSARLWWLELSRDLSSIVAAGPLVRDGSPKTSADDEDERFPNLASTPDGNLVLAYLAKSRHDANGTLMIARLTTASNTDSETGAPTVVPGSIRALTLNHRPELSPFSTDGRWIFGVVGEGRESPRILRYPTALETKGDRPTSG
jgi:hypothetical protein